MLLHFLGWWFDGGLLGVGLSGLKTNKITELEIPMDTNTVLRN